MANQQTNSAFLSLTPADWLKAGQRTMRWLVSHLREDGTWLHSRDCGAYFKAISAFAAYGMLAEAQRALNYLKPHFLMPDGDVRNSPHSKSGDAVYEQHADTYFNCLVAVGAWRLGRFDVAWPVVQHIAPRQVPQTGGFLVQRPGEDPVQQQDLFSTAGGTIALLTAGRLEEARRGAGWIASLFEQQADAATLYVRTDGNGQLIQRFPEADQKRYQVDPSRPDQMYVLPGTGVAALTLLYQVTHEEYLLRAATSALKRWSDDAIFQRSVQCCKHGWAAGLLWNATGDSQYRELVARAASSLISLQNDEGYWPYADLSWSFRYAFNAELAYWLAEYVRLVQPRFS